jgi:tubulin polyglutamylase TTLL6/13
MLHPPLPKKPPGITVNLEHTIYPAVHRSIHSLNYSIMTDHRITILFWHDGSASLDLCLRFKPFQFLNHFPGTFSITNKISLARSLERLQFRFPQLYNFHPQSFPLPTQLYQLQMLLTHTPSTFIIKPDLGSQGRGIFLVQEPQDLNHFKEPSIAQEYISPYLLSGLKFDLRIYVLLASVDPLRIYIFREGMARFCTEAYAPPDSRNLCEVYRHLTNYSLNKHNSKFERNGELNHKRSMSSIFGEIRRNGGDDVRLRSDIERIVVLTVLAGHGFLRQNYRASFRAPDGRSRCFEILGFDVLIDRDLKPWVLEVNHSPSFHCDSEFDLELKEKVITQALRIVDIPFDFYEFIQRTQKEKAFDSAGLSRPQFDRSYRFEREQNIARFTEWNLIYPAAKDSPLSAVFQEVFKAVEEMEIPGLDGNKGRRAMRNSHFWAFQKIVVPRPITGIDSTKPTRSVVLLQQAKKAKRQQTGY